MVNGTLIWYYFICKREVWLMAHQINPNQDDSNIDLGRFIHEHFYQRNKKEIIIGNCKFDILKKKHGNIIVGEIKKSSKFLKSAKHQLLYYLKQMKEIGIEATGEILIPEEKKKISVILDQETEKELEIIEKEIIELIKQTNPPQKEKIKYCYKCGYNEFCWA